VQNQVKGEEFGVGAPVAQIAPRPEGGPGTSYRTQAALQGSMAYVGSNEKVDIIDTATAKTVDTVRPQNRPLPSASESGAAPLVTSGAGPSAVFWPFLVSVGGGAPAVELTSIHSDGQKYDHVVVNLPGWVAASGSSSSVAAVGATRSAVVLDVGDTLGHTVMAVDPTTGKLLWARPNFAAVTVADDVVAGVESNLGTLPTAQISGVNASNGQPVWTQPRGYGIRLVSAGPALILVSRQSESAQSDSSAGTELISARTGAPVSRLPITGGDVRCLYDHAGVTVCQSPVDPAAGGRTVVAFDAQTGHQLWTMPISGTAGTGSGEAPFVTAAWHGHIYATATDAALTPASIPVVINGRSAEVPLTSPATTTVYRSHSGIADGTIAGSVPVVVDDQACLAIDRESMRIVARPRTGHD
jgi:hypothetical protein